jgi:hypothetical protein
MNICNHPKMVKAMLNRPRANAGALARRRGTLSVREGLQKLGKGFVEGYSPTLCVKIIKK